MSPLESARMRFLAGLVAFAVCITGCSRATQTATGDRHPWTIPHVLRIVDLSQPDRLNPYLSQMDISYMFSSLVYSYLVVADDRGQLVGDLALQAPTIKNGGISRDGRTVTYHLRRGVRWHDGKPFTSADVVASWKAVVDPKNLTLYRDGYDRVDSISTPDAYTAVAHLKERYPPFVTQFFAPLQEGAKPILPAHVLDRETNFNQGKLSNTAIGTGPFKFVKWEHAERIELARNDDYFRGKPRLEKIVISFIPDGNTEMTEMQLHHVDLIVAPNATLYPQYQKLQDVTVYTVPWNQQGLVIWNTSKPGLGDVTVRRALIMGIDRASIVKKVLNDVDEMSHDAIAPTAIGYVKRDPIPFDPDAANAMLDKAGWIRGHDGIRQKNGQRLDYTIATIAGSITYTRIPVLMQADLKNIGVNLNIKAYPYNQIFDFDGPIDTYRFDMAIYGSGVNWDPDTHVFFGCDQWFPNGQNFYKYCNKEYDRLEALGLTTDDPAKRAKIYQQADKIVWDTAAYLPIFATHRIVVRSPDLQNYRPNMTSTPWWNAWQWDI